LVVVSWVVAGLALLLAVAALASVRRLSGRLDALNRSYWELRYEYTRLRSQLSQLVPAADAEPDAPPAPSPSVSFVPLSTIRKKDK
jgi:acyl carrier protein phosphodiesterase